MECIFKVLKEKTNKIYAIGEHGGLILKDNNIKIYGEVILFSKGGEFAG